MTKIGCTKQTCLAFRNTGNAKNVILVTNISLPLAFSMSLDRQFFFKYQTHSIAERCGQTTLQNIKEGLQTICPGSDRCKVGKASKAY